MITRFEKDPRVTSVHDRNSELLPLLTTVPPSPLTEEPSPPLSSIVDEVSHLFLKPQPLSPSNFPPPSFLEEAAELASLLFMAELTEPSSPPFLQASPKLHPCQARVTETPS
ncbi:hypothetical protein PIB30_099277, partial [Stylosanthes scabra]|nr:hypothetical protein [Stylosanthes scabra]